MKCYIADTFINYSFLEKSCCSLHPGKQTVGFPDAEDCYGAHGIRNRGGSSLRLRSLSCHSFESRQTELIMGSAFSCRNSV